MINRDGWQDAEVAGVLLLLTCPRAVSPDSGEQARSPVGIGLNLKAVTSWWALLGSLEPKV